jgi:hypothetical protein
LSEDDVQLQQTFPTIFFIPAPMRAMLPSRGIAELQVQAIALASQNVQLTAELKTAASPLQCSLKKNGTNWGVVKQRHVLPELSLSC